METTFASIFAPRTKTQSDDSRFLLSEAELCAAKLDGELFPLGPSMVAWGWDNSPRTRALALRPHVPEGLVVDGNTALWVYGCIREYPRTLSLCASGLRRVRPQLDVPHVIRELRLTSDDMRRIEDLYLLSPLRLARDMLILEARRSTPPSPREIRERKIAIRMLCLCSGLTHDQIAEALLTSNNPYRKQALRLLD